MRLHEGNSYEVAGVRFKKACQCWPATASAPGITYEQKQNPVTVEFAYTLHAGPVCDKCGTPWTIQPRATPPTTHRLDDARGVGHEEPERT